MVPYLGDFAEDATVYIPFNTFSSDDPSASVTVTDLADADIKVHKDGSATQIVTDGATVAINFDSITGNHLITVDTSVHADYSTGSDYAVRLEGITVDGATLNVWVGQFSIENRFKEVTVTSMAANVITASAIASNAIAAAKIASNAITADKIATDAITAAKIAADALTSSEIAASANNAIADALLTRQMTESYAANGTAPTLAQAQFAIHQMLMQFGISGTSLTVRQLDDSTTAFVVTLDDATAPTDAKRV